MYVENCFGLDTPQTRRRALRVLRETWTCVLSLCALRARAHVVERVTCSALLYDGARCVWRPSALPVAVAVTIAGSRPWMWFL